MKQGLLALLKPKAVVLNLQYIGEVCWIALALILECLNGFCWVLGILRQVLGYVVSSEWQIGILLGRIFPANVIHCIGDELL